MPLAKQNISISFERGLDTKTDNKQVMPGSMLLLENAVFSTPKEFKKRNGYNSLGLNVDTGGQAIDSAVALAEFKNELNLLSGTRFYSRDDALSKWTDKGRFSSIGVIGSPVIRNANQQTSPDCAVHDVGIKLYTWEDSSGSSRYSVVDSSSGEFIVSNASLGSNVSKPKPFAIGQFIVILYVDSVTKQLNQVHVTALNPSVVSTPRLLTLDMNPNTNYDAVCLGQRVFVAYDTNQVGGAISLFYIDAFLTESLFFTMVGEHAAEAIGTFGVSVPDIDAILWVAYANGTNVKAFAYSYDLLTQLQPPTSGEAISGVRNIAGGVSNDDTQADVFYEIAATPELNTSIRKDSISVGGTFSGASRLRGSVGLASKVRGRDGRLYFLSAYQSDLQPAYFLLNDMGDIIGKVAPGLAGGLTDHTSLLPELPPLDDSSYLVSTLQKDLVVPASTSPANLYTQTGVIGTTIDFDSSTAYLSEELANNLHLTGGFLSMYDGTSVVEHGFHLFPENVSVVGSGVGGSIGAGTYQYFVTYEWIDNQGNLHRSAPSIAASVTTVGATSSVSITVATLRLTAKQGVSIVFYRTLANGTQPFRISPIASSPANDPTVDTITYVDTQADASIEGNQVLYTFGGVVDNISPPAVGSVFSYNERLIVIPSEQNTSFWFSKEVLPGAPVEFSDLFVQNVDPRRGGLTGGIQMDDKIILFREPSISYVSGTGPAPTGVGNDFTDTQLITTDVGCTNQRSIVLTPVGVMFQSAKGIYQLDRSMAVRYVGAPVEQFNGLLITSAELMATVNQVRFVTLNGPTLVYDYFMQQWSVFSGIGGVDAAIFEGQHVVVKSNGKALQQSTDGFTDDGQAIKQRLITGWLSFAGLQAFQRVYRLMILGDYKSPHKLLVKAAYDYNPFFTQQTYIDVATLFTNPLYGGDPTFGYTSPYGGVPGIGNPTYEFELHLTRQKCTAVQFSIEDVQMLPYGEGMSLSALGLQVGVKQGLNKLAASRKFA